MTEQEAIAYIENNGWSKTKLGLLRTRQLLKQLGDPQKKLKFIHVAGSNGKGSTCAFLASILQTAGYRTGLFISPHIQIFNERIQINGEMISGTALAQCTERVKAVAESMAEHPTQFEIITAIAMCYFCDAQCDIVVLEVGMGGAHDSTNVIDTPEVAVLTNIGLEHTEYLGDTLQAIAETKGGIIKTGTHCVCWKGNEQVTKVIGTICKSKEVPLEFVDISQIEILSSDITGQQFIFKDREYQISLIGKHQLNNAAEAITVSEVLRKKGWNISEADILQGIAAAQWPARMEVLQKEPLVLLDGGHNPQCAEALVNNLEAFFPRQKVTFILGMLADKDVGKVLEIIRPNASHFICLTPLSDRALPAEELAEMLCDLGEKAVGYDSVEAALKAALTSAKDQPVIAFGSLYLAGEIKTAFGK